MSLVFATSLAEWITAVGTLAAAIVAVVVAAFAVRQTHAANAQAELAREQLRRWKEEESATADRWFSDFRKEIRRRAFDDASTRSLTQRLDAIERAIRGEPRVEHEQGPLPPGFPGRPGS